MISENYASKTPVSFANFRGKVGGALPESGKLATPSNGNFTFAPVELSSEARQKEKSRAGFDSLLDGLAGWASPSGRSSESSNSTERPAQLPPNLGGWQDAMESGQMPMAILQQIFSTLKNAGGMATAGALHSLLSYGKSELERSGKIRPEFETMLRDAIAFGKENRLMDPASLQKWEALLFGGGGGKAKKLERLGKENPSVKDVPIAKSTTATAKLGRH